MNSSPAITVRLADSRDEAAVSSLLHQAVEESSRYRGLMPAIEGGSVTFVAVVGESIVGLLQYSTQDNDSALITCVHVHSAAREIGVADALMLHALGELRSNSIRWVAGRAQPGDRSLKNLFERHGLVAQSIVVGKSLSDPSTAERASQ